MSKDKGTTRRDFFKAATAAAVAAPLVLTSRNRRAEAAAPSERIVMGIVGPGKQGLGLMKTFMNFSEVQMAATCDVSQARRDYAKQVAEQKQKGKGCEAYADYRELLARKDIDAIICATPDHWHAAVCIEACRQGKDIYCEKPLSLTIGEAMKMIQAVRKYRRVFQTGSQQRSEHNFRFYDACMLVRNGRIGKIERVLVNVGNPSKPCDLPVQEKPEELDFNTWLGQAPLRGYNDILSPRGIPEKPKEENVPYYTNFPDWRNYREYSGGMMTDWGAHHFDIAQWGLDMDDSGPVEIIPPKGGEPLTYKYINGVIMQKVGKYEGRDVDGLRFVGADGWVEVNRGHLTFEPANIDKDPFPDYGTHLYKAPNGDHKLDFVQCVKARKRPICDIEIGARSVTVCHLGNLAWWNQRTLKWDPMRWQFVGDDEANTWIDRPQRSPFNLPEL